MKAIKLFFLVTMFFVAVFALYGILTCDTFAWWMIPTGIACAVYMIGFFRYEYKKVKRGEW